MSTALPDPIEISDVADESDQADVVPDVVVVGFGIAGGCAALEAARAGARVVVLARAATYGAGAGPAATRLPRAAAEISRRLLRNLLNHGLTVVESEEPASRNHHRSPG